MTTRSGLYIHPCNNIQGTQLPLCTCRAPVQSSQTNCQGGLLTWGLMAGDGLGKAPSHLASQVSVALDKENRPESQHHQSWSTNPDREKTNVFAYQLASSGCPRILRSLLRAALPRSLALLPLPSDWVEGAATCGPRSSLPLG